MGVIAAPERVAQGSEEVVYRGSLSIEPQAGLPKK